MRRSSGVDGGIVRLGVADEFQVSLILKNREVLGEIFLKTLGVRLGVRPEITGGGPGPGPKAAPPKGPSPGSQGDDHPVIAAMKRELGAEPI